MDKKFRIGVLGVRRGGAPLSAFREMLDYFEIVGIVEQDKELAQKWKEGLPETSVIFDSFDDMLDAGLDAVFLCDYFHTHYEHAIKALEKGVAVFSETTAAPSLGACVDLVETVERTGGIYMLMANCPYFKALQYAKKKMQDKPYGELVYAEGEYVHPVDPKTQKEPDLQDLHWRETLPQCYYNMHSLGPLMYVTESMPKKVMAKAAVHQHKKRPTNTPKTFNLTEMDNGAVFNSTGCVGVGTVGKWYRFAFEGGTMETERFAEVPDTLVYSDIQHEHLEKHTPSWLSSGAVTEEEDKEFGERINCGGHGGIDFVMCLDILRVLKGEKKPFFDVYRATALSAVGILSWYSVLSGGKEFEIPDFSNPADRDKVRGDYRMPFGKSIDDLTLPCRLDEDVEWNR